MTNLYDRRLSERLNGAAYQVLRWPEVCEITGLSPSSIRRRIKRAEFPAPVSLGGGRSVGWLRGTIEDWCMSLLDSEA